MKNSPFHSPGYDLVAKMRRKEICENLKSQLQDKIKPHIYLNLSIVYDVGQTLTYINDYLERAVSSSVYLSNYPSLTD